LGRSGERVANTPVRGIPRVVSGADREHVPPRFVEPRENHDLLALLDPVEASNEIRQDLEARVGGPFEALLGGLRTAFERGMNPGDRVNGVASRSLHEPDSSRPPTSVKPGATDLARRRTQVVGSAADRRVLFVRPRRGNGESSPTQIRS
jgi:hypothetical protein